MRITFLFGEIWVGLRRNLSMAVSVVLVTMVSLFFLGFGLLAQRQVDTMKDYWYDRVQVSIFLCGKDANTPSCAAGAVTDTQRQQILGQLTSMKPLVKAVYHETQEQAFQRFKKQYANSPLADNVTADQLPESYRVQLSDASKYPLITSSFQGAPGVNYVQDQRAVLQPLFTFLRVLAVCSLALAAAMVLCAVLLIGTTIRQTAFSRRRETGIMRLVGASAFTIQLPFILETALATLVGAALGVGLLWALIRFGVTGFLAKNVGLGFIGLHDLWVITPFLVGGGIALSVLTSWFTLRRYLRV